jgi:hypothetical protein
MPASGEALCEGEEEGLFTLLGIHEKERRLKASGQTSRAK